MVQTDYYYIMSSPIRKSQTGDERSKRPMELTTITYYTISKAEGLLAIVRYTAYNPDGLPELICEDFYKDSPDEFCRLERDVEKALVSGIDASVMSHYESEIFPVISTYLTL
tara:strand:- start:43 stop:378 length:336 start_codon:yes stop_codon:yes gene_type:complete